VSFQGFMANVMTMGVREFVIALQKLHADGKTGEPASLRNIGRIYGLNYQTLVNWMNRPTEHKKLFAFIEQARKDLGWKEETAYRRAVKG